MSKDEKPSFLSRLEQVIYDSKPMLFIGIAALILVGTSWGLPTLALSLAIVAYASIILFWRLEFRGSLKKLWMRPRRKTLRTTIFKHLERTKSPTQTSDSNNDPKD